MKSFCAGPCPGHTTRSAVWSTLPCTHTSGKVLSHSKCYVAEMAEGGTLIVGGNDERAIECNAEAANSRADLRHQLAAACIRRQVPYPDVAMLVTCS